MKKVLFVATVYKFLNFEKNDMKILKEMGFEIHTATNMSNEDWLKDDGCLDSLNVVKHHIDFSRSPFSFNNLKAYIQLRNLINDNSFSLIHCHTPIAGAITRIAALKARNNGTKIIYTSHGFHFNKFSSLKDWLFYFPIEYLLAPITDMIITINKEDFGIINKFLVKEKRYIPGVGINCDLIKNTVLPEKRIKSLKKELGLPEEAFIIINIGELSSRKNQVVIIKAMASLKNLNIYLIICGTGNQEQKYRKLINYYGLEKRVLLIGQQTYEKVIELCHIANIGILPSIIEGLGLAGLEVMAAGKPVIGSNVQGIKDYVIDQETGLLCNPWSVEDYIYAIKRFYQDSILLEKCSKNAYLKSKSFDISESKKLMVENYNYILKGNKNNEI